MDKRILIVIPWCSEGAQGRELEYAVAGWRRHFKDPYLIVLAGEDHPITKTGDDICCVPSPRVAPRDNQYRQHLDYVSCFRKVREAFPDTAGYVRVGDDCYAVRDFTLDDILAPKTIGEIGFNTFSAPGTWQGDKQRTRAALVDSGATLHNYTTHLPQFFEWDKMAALWERYAMDRVSYVDEDLYYNIYEGSLPATNVHAEPQPYKCGIYRSNPDVAAIEAAFGNKIWITNSPVGWVPQLDMMLDQYYNGAGTWLFKK